MTAEVAILNKIGIALAADSTVSIGDKTYHTANKLFSLSKHHPVGVLIWNTTELNTIPLEVIIKEFRHKLGKKSYKTLRGYSDAFLRYIETEIPIGPQEQKAAIKDILRDFAEAVLLDFYQDCAEQGMKSIPKRISGNTEAIFNTRLDQFERSITSAKVNTNFGGMTPADLEKTYPRLAVAAIEVEFTNCRPTTNQKKRFSNLLWRACLSNLLSNGKSGIVIAGYGTTEYYPAYFAHETNGIFADRHKIITKKQNSISRANPAILAPFAQRDAANLFMEGVDRSYQRHIDNSLHPLFEGIANVAAQHFGIIDQQKIGRLRKVLASSADAYIDSLHNVRRSEFINRVLAPLGSSISQRWLLWLKALSV